MYWLTIGSILNEDKRKTWFHVFCWFHGVENYKNRWIAFKTQVFGLTESKLAKTLIDDFISPKEKKKEKMSLTSWCSYKKENPPRISVFE